MTTTLPAGITAETRTQSDGGTNYVLSGPAGAVSIPRLPAARVPAYVGDSFQDASSMVRLGFGPVGIHSRFERGSRPPMECDALEEGRCWADVAYGGGNDAAEAFECGGEDALWTELYGWYRAQLAPYEED